MVLMLYGIHAKYLTLNSDFSMTFELLKTEMVDLSLISKKCSVFLEKSVGKCLSLNSFST